MDRARIEYDPGTLAGGSRGRGTDRDSKASAPTARGAAWTRVAGRMRISCRARLDAAVASFGIGLR
jgi:hypothetical protein